MYHAIRLSCVSAIMAIAVMIVFCRYFVQSLVAVFG
jgi:hypothetical protein